MRVLRVVTSDHVTKMAVTPFERSYPKTLLTRVTGRGSGPSRVTPSRGVTPDLKLFFVAEF